MKLKLLVISFLLLNSAVASAGSTNVDYLDLANSYADAWFKTQMPNATDKDLQHFLSFLTDDVAYQHLPYDKTDEREEGGKEALQKGMTQWLASNVDYQATINSVNFSHNLITINYDSTTTIIDPKTKQSKTIRRHVIDSLELDNGKVSVIRKYW